MNSINDVLNNTSGFLSLGGRQTAVGLSVGTSSIKVVELQRARKGWKLLHFGMVQLPQDAIVNREIVNSVAVSEAISTLASQLKLKNKSVCLSITGTSLIIKRMAVEVTNPKELEDQVFWEAEQYLPFDISEVVMDFQLLSKKKEKNADILLVAVKRSVLDSYLGVVEDSGLKSKIVDVDFFALQNLYEANYPANPSEAVGMIDIGASSMKIVIVQGGIPVFTKDAVIGGNNLTLEIQKHLSLSFADAETLKVSGQGAGMPQEVNDLMTIAAENYANEIKRALDYYNASSTGGMVNSLLLAGGGSKVPGLSRVVEETLGIPTQMINPFNSVTYDPSIFTDDYVSSIAPIAAVPIGLALRAGAE